MAFASRVAPLRGKRAVSDNCGELVVAINTASKIVRTTIDKACLAAVSERLPQHMSRYSVPVRHVGVDRRAARSPRGTHAARSLFWVRFNHLLEWAKATLSRTLLQSALTA